MNDFLPRPDLGLGRLPEDTPEADYGGLGSWEEVEREAERSYIGSVVFRKAGSGRSTVAVEPKHFSASIRADLLAALRSMYPWSDITDLMMKVVYSLSRRYGKQQAQAEWVACCTNPVQWGQVDPVAQQVVNGYLRRERSRIARCMLDSAHDAEAMRLLVDDMNQTIEGPPMV